MQKIVYLIRDIHKLFLIEIQQMEICKISKEMLETEYLINRKSTLVIAKDLGVNPTTIQNYLKRYKIPTRKQRKRDFTNKKFGSWTVIKFDYKKNNTNVWLCRCDCGAEQSLITTTLTGKKDNSKCAKCSKMHMRGPNNFRASYLNRIKRNAKDRNLDFNITLEYCQNLYIEQKGICALTGLPISFGCTWEEYVYNKNAASLDRINSAYGYIENNIQWIHRDVNIMKQNFNQDYFLYICQMICKNNKQIDSTPERIRENMKPKYKS